MLKSLRSQKPNVEAQGLAIGPVDGNFLPVDPFQSLLRLNVTGFSAIKNRKTLLCGRSLQANHVGGLLASRSDRTGQSWHVLAWTDLFSGLSLRLFFTLGSQCSLDLFQPLVLPKALDLRLLTLAVAFLVPRTRHDYNFAMLSTARKNAHEILFVLVLRHLGIEREVLVIKARPRDFQAFLPSGKAGVSDVEIHASRHEASTHMVARHRDEKKWRESEFSRFDSPSKHTMRPKTEGKRPPIDALKGSELFWGCNILAGQFPNLEPVGTNSGERVVLDAEAENFRDEFTGVRLYLVEPHQEDTIPSYDYAKPRILHLIKRTTPWIAVEVFQLASASALAASAGSLSL
jgi:hypothetical protein